MLACGRIVNRYLIVQRLRTEIAHRLKLAEQCPRFLQRRALETCGMRWRMRRPLTSLAGAEDDLPEPVSCGEKGHMQVGSRMGSCCLQRALCPIIGHDGATEPELGAG
jgi:hypothetical protein